MLAVELSFLAFIPSLACKDDEPLVTHSGMPLRGKQPFQTTKEAR